VSAVAGAAPVAGSPQDAGAHLANEVHGWTRRWGRKRQTAEAFQGSEEGHERHIGYQMAGCGSRLLFRVNECGHGESVRLVGANLCRHRLCPHCAKRRSIKLGARCKQRVEDLAGHGVRRYALLTLTLRDGEKFDQRTVTRLWAAFRQLRRRDLWNGGRVLGVYAGIEVKRSARLGGWHPHIHALVARPACPCRRFGQPIETVETCAHGTPSCAHSLNHCCIAAAWFEITGDSYVVDIRAVRYGDGAVGVGGAVAEVTKYVTKLTEIELTDVLTVHRGIRGRHLLLTTGVFRGIKEPKNLRDLLDGDEQRCAHCGSPAVLVVARWRDARYVVVAAVSMPLME